MDDALTKLKAAQKLVGGGIIYLDYEFNNQCLEHFYENAGFKICGDYISQSDNTRYKRVLKLF